MNTDPMMVPSGVQKIIDQYVSYKPLFYQKLLKATERIYREIDTFNMEDMRICWRNQWRTVNMYLYQEINSKFTKYSHIMKPI